MGNTGKTVGTVGGAAAGSVFGPAGTVVGGFLGGAIGSLFDGGGDSAPKPPPVDPTAFERPDTNAAAAEYSNNSAVYQGQGQRALSEGRNNAWQTNQAAALGYNGARAQATAQNMQGNAALQTQQSIAGTYNTAGRNAGVRTNPTMDMAGYDASRAQQAAALGGVAQQARQGTDTSNLRDFYQQGPGPSAAEAQLQQGSEASMAQALALSRSGRAGANPAAERQAMFQNAATMQQTNQQAAQLRAQEAANWRGQQLNAMTAEQQAQAQGRNAQLAALGLQQQSLAGMSQQDLAAQQAQANLALQGRQQNDQTALAYGQLSNQSQALGYQTALGYGQLANASQAQGNAYQIGMGGLANQQQALGTQTYLGAGQLGLGYQGMSEASVQADREAQMRREALKQGQSMSQYQFDTLQQNQRDAANMGMAMGATNALATYAGQSQQADAANQAAAGAAAGQSAFNSGYDPYGINSDERVKRDVRPLPDMGRTYAALGGPPATRGVPRRDVDTDALDEAHDPYAVGAGAPRRQMLDPNPYTDMRAARGYNYEYTDPGQYGRGRFAGPMAQDLEKSPATAGVVYTDENGVKKIDTGRLALTNTSVISEQQRRIDELEALVKADGRNKRKPAQYAALGGR